MKKSASPEATVLVQRDATVRPLGPASETVSARRSILSLARRLKESELLRPFIIGMFRTFQRIGINVTPNHYYWPIPDLRELEHREWRVDPNPAGLDLRLGEQLEFLNSAVRQYQAECGFADAPGEPGWEFHYNNGWFESVDAEIAYAMVRHYRPRRIIEIGGGFSTRVLAKAVRQNDEQYGFECDLTTIEPYPDKVLKSGIPGVSRLIEKPIQEVELEQFLSLGERDILFIDSSHVVRVGSDCIYEYLDILPRLQKGVIVHVHDIFLPSDYPRDAVLDRLCFWSEQYLLQAFLALNRDYEVLWGSSAMQMFHGNELESALPAWRDSYSRMPQGRRQFIPTFDHRRVWPSSFWIRRVHA
jgi:Methyltransferase domain